ncbi:MAG TPA: F0F1 ATP synthase subunit gamma [Alphaproteobacteria bacterium]|nr:F0F1 ATP synthase subunit gamma [Alphaproteobacteria bacterium]
MEQLPRLKARIASLEELRDLIGALRAMAGARVQEAQEALAGIRRYAQVVERAIAENAALLSRTSVSRRAAPVDRGILIVVTSEHGFTGAFNDRLIARAREEQRPDLGLGIVGRRGAVLAEEAGIEVDWSVPMATHIGGVPAIARRVADRLAAVSTARIVFAAYRTGGQYEIEARDILPLDPRLLRRMEHVEPPLHQLEPYVLLERLSDEYLFAEVTHALMESLASENGARLQVMSAADHNIGDKLETLGRRHHHLRQEAITAELLDVVIGAEAVNGS